MMRNLMRRTVVLTSAGSKEKVAPCEFRISWQETRSRAHFPDVAAVLNEAG
jgi:hypothetical protein